MKPLMLGVRLALIVALAIAVPVRAAGILCGASITEFAEEVRFATGTPTRRPAE